jgi:hypothetical protein
MLGRPPVLPYVHNHFSKPASDLKAENQLPRPERGDELF